MFKWIIGLGISLVIGHFVTSCVLFFLHRHVEKRKVKDKDLSKLQLLFASLRSAIDPHIGQVPPWIVGPAERLFFTLIIAFNISGAAVAMVAWITLKMLTSRQYLGNTTDSKDVSSFLPFEFTGLLGNLTSMFFALIGGLVILCF